VIDVDSLRLLCSFLDDFGSIHSHYLRIRLSFELSVNQMGLSIAWINEISLLCVKINSLLNSSVRDFNHIWRMESKKKSLSRPHTAFRIARALTIQRFHTLSVRGTKGDCYYFLGGRKFTSNIFERVD
jgi:hypothetical protein